MFKEVFLKSGDRIFLFPLLKFFFSAISEMIIKPGSTMLAPSVSHKFQKYWTATRINYFEGFFRHFVYVYGVVTIASKCSYAVTFDKPGNTSGWLTIVDMGINRVEIVFAYVKNGNLLQSRKIYGFVGHTFFKSGFSQKTKGCVTCTPQILGPSDTSGYGNAACNNWDRTQEIYFLINQV